MKYIPSEVLVTSALVSSAWVTDVTIVPAARIQKLFINVSIKCKLFEQIFESKRELVKQLLLCAKMFLFQYKDEETFDF